MTTKLIQTMWENPDDYFRFCREFKVYGKAAIKLKKEMSKTRSIGEPKIERILK